MKFQLTLIASIFISGCVSIPDTSTELVNTTTTNKELCYDFDATVVTQRSHDYMTKCYGTVSTIIPIGGALTPISHTFDVMQEEIDGGIRFSVSNFVGYGLAEEIRSGEGECTTKVNFYAVTSLWERHFDQIDLAIQNKEFHCPM